MNSSMREDVKKIILESIDGAEYYDGTEVFSIQKYLHELLGIAATNPDLMVIINRFEDRIENGENAITLFEDFGRSLEKFGFGNREIKDILTEMNAVADEHASEFEAFKLIYSLNDIPAVQQNILDRYNEFLSDPCDETKLGVLDEINNLYEAGDYEQIAIRLTLIVNEAADIIVPQFVSESVYNSRQERLNKQAEENRRMRLTEDIFKKVDRYIAEREAAAEEKRQQMDDRYSLNGIAGKNGLNLLENLKKVINSDAVRNQELKNVVTTYANALRQGAYEERLYETLLHNTSKFDYLVPVERMRNAIIEAATKNAEQITLTKILEEMKDSSTSYIYVDIIQEDVARYVLNPSSVNRIQLRNALMPFAADPYINKMFECIYLDEEKRFVDNVEKQAFNIKEQIDIIRQNATVSNIYTPVQYIKEGESIFNVHGQYFVRKGNHISVLEKKYIPKLDPRFVELCHLVNDPNVQICEDRIILYGNEYTATVFEGYVEIAGSREDRESLRRLNEMCLRYENYDTNFYITCSVLLENFNRIAKIDWAKHITLNSNTDITADIFKLDENLYIATHDNSVMNHTFYRNVNPIFCKNTLNEHMGINVSSLFEDMLPDQNKIIMRLNETKNEYEKSIEQYEKALDDLKDAKSEATDDSIISELNDAISDTEQKLKDVQDEYKEWQKNAEESTKDADSEDVDTEDNDEQEVDDEDVIKEPGSEPIEPEEVDDYREELATPLADDDPENGMTDSQFDDILAGGDGEVEATDEEDDVIDTDYIDAQLAGDVIDDDDDEVVFDNDSEEVVDDNDIYNDDDDIISGKEDIIDTDTLPVVDDDDDDEVVIGDVDIDDEDVEGEVLPEPMNTVDAETGLIDTDAEPGDEDVPAPTDMFGGDVKNPLGIDANFYNPNVQRDDFSIVNVSFDYNVMDNKMYKSGIVTVLRPMVAYDGAQYTDTINYPFNIDDSKHISLKIDTSDSISTALYTSIVMSIKNHPSFDKVMSDGLPGKQFSVKDDAKDVAIDTDWEDEYEAEGNEEDKGNFVVGEPDVDVEVFDDVIDLDAINGKDVTNKPTAKFNFDDDDEYTKLFGDDDDESEIPASNVDIDIENSNGSELDIDIDSDGNEEVIATPAPENSVVADDDYPDISDLFDDDDSEEVNDPVQTYTKDGTEYEFPADNVDDTVIPENKQNKVKSKRLNENRARIISVRVKK